MKLENEFVVPASVDDAWKVLLDVERVAPCLPGAEIEKAEGDAYNGTMTVKIGPITAKYKGTIEIEEADDAAHRAVMKAKARDARGQGGAQATITSTMESSDEGTRVKVETDMRVTGAAAQFGRGVMQDVSAQMMGRFADCLASEMSGGDGAQAEAGADGAQADTEEAADAGSAETAHGRAAARRRARAARRGRGAGAAEPGRGAAHARCARPRRGGPRRAGQAGRPGRSAPWRGCWCCSFVVRRLRR